MVAMLVAGLALALLAGCRAPVAEPPAHETGNIALTGSTRAEMDAGILADLRAEIRAAKAALEQGTADADVHRIRIAELTLLYGAGYSGSRREQRLAYHEAKQLALQVLRLNADMAELLASAQPLTALVPLANTGTEFDALLIHSTAVFYLFRDVYTLPQRVFASGRLKAARDVLLAMQEREPGWSGGTLPFSLGIFYLAVPDALGGDRALAAQLMAEAVALGPTHLLPRWGRAKYLAVALADRQLFTEDLQWVIAQDLNAMDGPDLWNRYFQWDAQQLLNHADALFRR